MRDLKCNALLVFPTLLSISLLSFVTPIQPSRPLTVTAQAHRPSVVSAQTAVGTIAYIRPGGKEADEIWLIESDGSNARRIWTVGQPDENSIIEVWDLDWRPDAAELAFASDHEQTCSLYETDLFAIRPDGSGYRRITNSPDCAALASYPQGSVAVTVRNLSTHNPLDIYVQGAPGTQTVVVSQGTSASVTFPTVADFGDGVVQQAVAIWVDRWITANTLGADVIAGQTVQSNGRIDVGGDGIEHSGASIPSWHSDGTRLGFIFDIGSAMAQIPSNPAPNESGTYLLNTQNVLAKVLDWGPASKADQILYWIQVKDGVGDGGIYQVTEGSDNRGTELIDTGVEEVIDIQWLPDGSGFLFTKIDNFRASANVYHYDFALGAPSKLTHFANEYAIDISPSPDSQWIVFERASTLQLTSGDLWIMQRDGTEQRLLVQNGMRPSWSSQAPQLPSTSTPTPTITPAPGTPTPATTPSPSVTRAGKGYLPLVKQ